MSTTVSKADRSYEILKQRIMQGVYGPGHRLVIDQLTRETGITSVPWRESLRRLEAEGWVEISRNVGATVRTFDTDAWHRTLRLLARLEGLATALSAPRLTADDLESARSLNVQMRTALRDLDTMSFGALNRRFHELLCSRCDDERLLDLVSTEWARLELIRRSAFWYAPGRAVASLAEHEELVELIAGGADFDVIETAARHHEISTLQAVAQHEQALRAAG